MLVKVTIEVDGRQAGVFEREVTGTASEVEEAVGAADDRVQLFELTYGLIAAFVVAFVAPIVCFFWVCSARSAGIAPPTDWPCWATSCRA